MANNRRVTIRIRGLDKDNGDVRFDDFIKQLSTVKTALAETDRIVSSKPSVYFKVIDLRHNSPAQIVLESVPLTSQDDRSDVVVNKFFDSLEEIDHGVAPNGFDYDAFQAFREISSLYDKKRLTEIVISRNGDTGRSFESLSRQVDSILGPDQYEYGSVTGLLDQINIHANQNVFTIYPTSKQPKLRCIFQQHIKKDAIKAVGEYVKVYGQLKFKTKIGDGHPYEMAVRDIEVFPRNEELPTLASLRGIAPNATGNLTSEQFVRRIRNDW